MTKPFKAFFFVIDGPDLCGKTSLVKILKKKLEDENFNVYLTMEPNQKINNFNFRNYFFNNKNEKNNDPLLDALFFIADRRINLKKIKKWDDENKKTKNIVICDRYFYSTFVYQGCFSNIDFEKIEKIHHLLDAWVVPDLTLFFSNKKKTFLIQRETKNQKNDRFHKISNNIPLKIFDYYQKVAFYFQTPPHQHKIFFIDVANSLEMNVEIIFNKLINHV